MCISDNTFFPEFDRTLTMARHAIANAHKFHCDMVISIHVRCSSAQSVVAPTINHTTHGQ